MEEKIIGKEAKVEQITGMKLQETVKITDAEEKKKDKKSETHEEKTEEIIKDKEREKIKDEDIDKKLEEILNI